MGSNMDQIVCTHCGWAFEQTNTEKVATVEWLADANGKCFADSIRVTHRMCQYADTIGTDMDQHQLWDRWFPLATLDKYIKIIRGMCWDNSKRAMQTINEVIQNESKRN